MKKFYISAFAIAISASLYGQSKLDAGSRHVISQYRIMKANPEAVVAMPETNIDMSAASRGNVQASAFITLADGVSFEQISNFSLEVSCPNENIAIVNGDLDDIIALSESDLVIQVSLSSELKPLLDTARKDLGIDNMHKGTGLPDAYKGAGVICGIYDSGVDPNHINFMKSDLSGTRVKRVWNATGSTGGFIEYATPERIATFTTDSRTSTHGTHTTGCMAGSFNRASSTSLGLTTRYASLMSPTATGATVLSTRKVPYYGMAPEADIAIGCGSLTNTNIVNGVQKIVEYAKSTGQPAVINLSIGSVAGPHDGTDYISRYMTKYGKDAIICMSAGNNGDSKLSITKNCTANDNEVKTFITLGTVTGSVDIWASDNRPVTVIPLIYDLASGSIEYQYPISAPTDGNVTIATNNYTATSYIHDAAFDKAFSNSFWQLSSTVDAINNRYNMNFYYDLKRNTSSNSDSNLVPGFIVRGQTGQRIDIVNNSVGTSTESELISNGVSGWTEGSPEFSINSIACSPEVIVVGAYTTKARWGNLKGQVYHYTDEAFVDGEIAPFSSFGTLIDGRRLPHICAPGAAIISSYSSYYYSAAGLSDKDVTAEATYNGKTHYWAAEQGTSMSCPIVAGTIALWLQADPQLKVADARKYLQQTATSDNNNDDAIKWGAGKINALEGLKTVIQNSNSVSQIVTDNNQPVFTDLDGSIEVFVPNASEVCVTVYNTAGMAVDHIKTQGNTATVNTADLSHGIYILKVEGTNTAHRIAVR